MRAGAPPTSYLLTLPKRLAALQSVSAGRVYDLSHEIGMDAPFLAPNQTPVLLSTWATWRDSIRSWRVSARRSEVRARDFGTHFVGCLVEAVHLRGELPA